MMTVLSMITRTYKPFREGTEINGNNRLYLTDALKEFPDTNRVKPPEPGHRFTKGHTEHLTLRSHVKLE